MNYLSFQGAGASSSPKPTSSPSLSSPESQASSSSSSSSSSFEEALAAEVMAWVDEGQGGEVGSAAPWCVNTWGVDGGLSGKYPLSVKELQAAIDVPLQLYAPYFCPNSQYFNGSFQGKNWTAVKSDTNMSGCASYGFQDITPAESMDFYSWFFDKGLEAGGCLHGCACLGAFMAWSHCLRCELR